MKDHEIAELINQVRDVAIEFGQTQQLRERLASLLVPVLKEREIAGYVPSYVREKGLDGYTSVLNPEKEGRYLIPLYF